MGAGVPGVRPLAARLSKAARITVMTGAGVSAASGVPTFRGPGGLWKSHRPEELATPEAFARNPGLAWEWYDWRRQQIAACQPNAAHRVLASWTRRLSGFSLVTQNVDGLHERAAASGNPEGLPPQKPGGGGNPSGLPEQKPGGGGNPSGLPEQKPGGGGNPSGLPEVIRGGGNPSGLPEVIRLHGSIWDMQCWTGCAASPPRWRDESVPLSPMPPRCPHCGGLVRPGVVWFGEPLDWGAIEQADDAATCDVFLAVGTSSVVYPAASFVQRARRRGAFTVEVNPDATPASDAVDLVLRGAAETILPELESLL